MENDLEYLGEFAKLTMDFAIKKEMHPADLIIYLMYSTAEMAKRVKMTIPDFKKLSETLLQLYKEQLKNKEKENYEKRLKILR